ncbi:exosortase [Colwellia sp. BRX10-3]|uniref:exosortase n=1 Tax=Colwellia sp. BRX10-3 TaxID=2759844 RepID=UPI0015F70607|nr:exosortase [Colwellia sp. BRX10-3]MBA6391067.1 exosortase [Colwellia sp. BRX10-3]
MIKLNTLIEIARTFFKTPLLGVLLIIFTVSLLNIPVLETLWRHSFDDGTYSHAYLIPIISLYLFYILQSAGKITFRTQLSIPATAIFILSCLALYITSNAQISLGYWCSVLAVLVTSINMLYKFNKYIVFPSLFFIFILPVWGILNSTLQAISVNAVKFLMSYTGIPTYVEGNFVTIPAGVFQIAGGCSGLRYFIVSLAISSIFTFLHIKSTKKALMFFSIAIVGALVTNWIRITALILIGEYTDMQSSLMDDHNTFGWYLFIPFMIILFWWGNKLADVDVLTPCKIEKTKAIPNLYIVMFLLSALTLSSTSLQSLLHKPINEISTQIQLDKTSPTIYMYSSVKSVPLNSNKTIYQIFSFSAQDLDEKPSYFGNDILPEGYKTIKTETKNGWNLTYARLNKNKAVILHKYEIDNITYTDIRNFKLARLKKALFNIKNTKLHWVYLTCDSNCESTIEDFFNSQESN